MSPTEMGFQAWAQSQQRQQAEPMTPPNLSRHLPATTASNDKKLVNMLVLWVYGLPYKRYMIVADTAQDTMGGKR